MLTRYTIEQMIAAAGSASALSDLTDVDLTDLSSGMELRYNGTNWVPLFTPHTRVNVLDYGADPTGTADSTEAIQDAINALPAYGGVVFFPVGDYKISSTIHIGNGSDTAISTRMGIVLEGEVPGGVWVFGLFENPDGDVQGVVRIFTETEGIVMFQVNGPLQGWGLRNLFIDGSQGPALAGIDERACVGGDSYNVVFWQAGTSFAQRCKPRVNTGALANVAPNHSRNLYRGFSYRVPNVNGARAVFVDDNGSTNTTDCWGDTWYKTSIQFQAPSGTNVLQGFHLKGCDNIIIEDIFFSATAATADTAKFYGFTFDYSGQWPNHPSATWIDIVDFNTVKQTDGTIPVRIIGSAPSVNSTSMNKISRVFQGNGSCANPNLANLEWEGVKPRLSKAISSTSVTLTTQESFYDVIRFTGTLTANTTVTLVPSAGKSWILENGTSGAFTLTFENTDDAGSGVAIATGKRAIVYSDGTSLFRVSPDT